MNEEFLTYVWRFRLLGHTLITTSGEPLEILVPGEHNANAGPDFFNARIRIGGTLWAGNVELHVLASDWYRHGQSLPSWLPSARQVTTKLASLSTAMLGSYWALLVKPALVLARVSVPSGLPVLSKRWT